MLPSLLYGLRLSILPPSTKTTVISYALSQTDSLCEMVGHITRMPDYRLPKHVFFGELCSGDKSRARPRKQHKCTLKVAFAQDRVTWEPCQARCLQIWTEVQSLEGWQAQGKTWWLMVPLLMVGLSLTLTAPPGFDHKLLLSAI